MRFAASTAFTLALVGLTASPSLAESTPTPGVKIKTLVQTFYTADQAAPDSFSIRRMNLYLNGVVTPSLSYGVMMNPVRALALPKIVSDPNRPGSFLATSGGDDRILQDAYVKATFGPSWALQAGQFKVPVSAEALEPAGDLLTARRARFNEGSGQIGFFRDIGLQLVGQPAAGLTMTLGVFNGETQNVLDTNEQKAFAGRVVFAPTTGFQIGASQYLGATGAALTTRQRTDLNAEWDLAAVSLKAEAIGGLDGATRELGWYGQLAGYVAPNWQLLARYESWNPDIDAATTREEQDATLGVNWYFAGSSKAALNYIHQQLPAGKTDDLGIAVWQLII